MKSNFLRLMMGSKPASLVLNRVPEQISNLVFITEDGIFIRTRGKVRQCLIETMFALRWLDQHKELDAFLIEDLKKHLNDVNLKKLVNKLASERQI